MLISFASWRLSWNWRLKLHRLPCHWDLLCLNWQMTEGRLALPLRNQLLMFYGHLLGDLEDHCRCCLLVRVIRRVQRGHLIIIYGLFLPEVFCDLSASVWWCLLKQVGRQRNLIQSLAESRLIQDRLRYSQYIWYLLVGSGGDLTQFPPRLGVRLFIKHSYQASLLRLDGMFGWCHDDLYFI